MKLVYSQDALDDLIRLREFIAIKNPEAASRIGQELADRIDALLAHPLAGRPVQLAPDPESLRDLIFGNYVIRYLPTTEAVIVLREWHHREDRA